MQLNKEPQEDKIVPHRLIYGEDLTVTLLII